MFYNSARNTVDQLKKILIAVIKSKHLSRGSEQRKKCDKISNYTITNYHKNIRRNAAKKQLTFDLLFAQAIVMKIHTLYFLLDDNCCKFSQNFTGHLKKF